MKVTAFLTMALAAGPTYAWEFTPGSPCLLTHQTGTLAIKLTFDPTAPLYTISLTQQSPLTTGSVFSMQFEGAMPIAISTDRQTYSPDGKTVSVADSGFGNVLNGLQFNYQVTATLGDQQMVIPLIGAADPVARFRACDIVPSA